MLTHVRFADLLKNKSRPEAAAEGAAAWVVTERVLREKLKKEREAKERELEKEVRLLRSALSGYRVLNSLPYRRRKEKRRKARQRRQKPRRRRKRPRRMIR